MLEIFSVKLEIWNQCSAPGMKEETQCWEAEVQHIISLMEGKNKIIYIYICSKLKVTTGYFQKHSKIAKLPLKEQHVCWNR